MSDNLTLLIRPLPVRRFREITFEIGRIHFPKVGPERDGEGQYGAGVVHVLVYQLVEEPNGRPGLRILRHQPRLGEALLQVVEDDRGSIMGCLSWTTVGTTPFGLSLRYASSN
jgi:hypothetical protein